MEGNIRRYMLVAPFSDGYVSDLPEELLGPRMAYRLEDFFIRRGIVQRRMGWAYDGGSTEGDSITTTRGFDSVARAAFRRADSELTTMTIMDETTPYLSSVVVHGAGTVITPAMSTNTGSNDFVEGVYLARCIYRDEVIYCCQSGQHPLLRYAGHPTVMTVLDDDTTSNVSHGKFHELSNEIDNMGVATAGSSSINANVGYGMIIGFRAADTGLYNNADWPWFFLRPSKIIASGNEIGFENVLPTGDDPDTTGSITMIPANLGFAAPCVVTTDKGTINAASGTYTRAGEDYSTGAKVYFPSDTHALAADGILYEMATPTADNLGEGQLHQLTSFTSSIPNDPVNLDDGDYKMSILRRMPFKDAAVFRQCLFGCGVYQYPSRLYYFPQGGDIGIPPGFARDGVSLDPFQESPTATDALDFTMDYVEVPSSFDSDPIVAIVPTDTALWALKRSAVYRITGDYPTFRSDLAEEAAGCIDIRSAINDETGVYWAGDTGIWTIRNGYPYNLAAPGGNPGILNEWRELMAEGITGPTRSSTSWVACGVMDGFLVVSVRTEASTEVCFVMNLMEEKWCGKFTNILPRYMWSSRIQGETAAAYAVSDDAPRRVLELSAMFRDGAFTDGDSGTPLGVAQTGSRVFVGESELGEYRLLSMDLAVVFTDTSTPTSTVNLTIHRGDAVDQATDSTTSLTSFDATVSTDPIAIQRRPGTRGRRQSLLIEQADQDASFAGFEIHEIKGQVRMLGERR